MSEVLPLYGGPEGAVLDVSLGLDKVAHELFKVVSEMDGEGVLLPDEEGRDLVERRFFAEKVGAG